MALLASHMALEDARMGNGLPENTGLIVATGMGPTANTLDLQPADVAATDLALSPILFSNSVQNAAAAYISMLLKIRGPIVSINQYEMAVPLAFQAAIDWLEEGRTETVLVGSVDCLSKALQEASLSGKGSENGDSRPPDCPIGEGSAFFVLTRPSAQGSKCPFVHQVLLGRKGRTVEIPVPATVILHNGPIENADGAVRPRMHANFTHLYGVFPTSMGMDVAAALLLLRADRLLNTAVPRFAGGPAAQASSRIGCLKQGETGDWGMVVVGK
jgi:3-oxoacyl-[acyl-carrier-protein] synthase II